MFSLDVHHRSAARRCASAVAIRASKSAASCDPLAIGVRHWFANKEMLVRFVGVLFLLPPCEDIPPVVVVRDCFQKFLQPNHFTKCELFLNRERHKADARAWIENLCCGVTVSACGTIVIVVLCEIKLQSAVSYCVPVQAGPRHDCHDRIRRAQLMFFKLLRSYQNIGPSELK